MSSIGSSTRRTAGIVGEASCLHVPAAIGRVTPKAPHNRPLHCYDAADKSGSMKLSVQSSGWIQESPGMRATHDQSLTYIMKWEVRAVSIKPNPNGTSTITPITSFSMHYE